MPNARGTEFGEGSLLNQMKTLIPIFLPLFVSSINRAEDMANVMEVRGYQSGSTRSSFRKLQWNGRDTPCLIFHGFIDCGINTVSILAPYIDLIISSF